MDYKKLTSVYKDEMIKNLKDFVAIPSVYENGGVSEKEPFGKEVAKALQFITDLANKDGFVATNYDNMVVEILAGTGKKNITIMAHADVVPAGSGWDQDPFEMIIKDETLHGRGVADDKGPCLAAYYALKALKDNNLLGDYTVRLLVGGNEETGSACMEHYFHTLNKPQPDLGFTPDSAFPLVYGEKGILGFKVETDFHIDGLISFDGGVASNSVIEKCVVKMNKNKDFISLLKEDGVDFDFEEKDDIYEITFHGVAAHGSVPWMGVNAGVIAIKYLAMFFNNKELTTIYEKYADTKANGVKANSYSEDMFDNSLNVGLINYKNNHFSMVVNFRYVNGCTPEWCIEQFKKNSPSMNVTLLGTSPLLFFPTDSILVSTLLKAYQEESGDYETKPGTSGGGTYAKEANNVVAFGIEYPGRDYNMHSPGENIKIEELVLGMAIYANAIISLGEKL